jgi:hypothetical protein
MRGCIEGVMLSILDDLLLDPDVKDHSDQTNYSSLELFPYYAQLCKEPRNGILPDKSETTLSIDESCSKPGADPRWNTIVTEESSLPGPSRMDFLSSLEFQNFAESILESTLYNLMQEANADEWDVTKFPMLFSKTG